MTKEAFLPPPPEFIEELNKQARYGGAVPHNELFPLALIGPLWRNLAAALVLGYDKEPPPGEVPIEAPMAWPMRGPLPKWALRAQSYYDRALSRAPWVRALADRAWSAATRGLRP